MSDRRVASARLPTEEELALWRAAMRDTVPRVPQREPAGVEQRATEQVETAPPPPRFAPAVPVHRPRPAPSPRRLDTQGPVDLDRRTWQRLRRGRMPIDGRIDLHGMTRDEAYRALAAFLARMRQAGARCVLVITGRGLRTGGVLRHAVPHWLEAPGLREMVLAFGPARIEHGGEGALYILLRRRAKTAT